MTFVDIGQDLDAYLDAPCSIIIMGEAGVGKSTEIAKVAQDCLWVVSSRKELRSYASYLVMRKAEAEALTKAGKSIPDDLARDLKRTMPRKVVEVPEFSMNEKGETIRVSNEVMVKTIVNAYKARLAKDANAYSGIVFDTWSIIAKRIQDDLIVRFGDKGWDVARELHAFHRWLMRDVPQTSGKSLILACHKREPEFDKGGALKHMGGPTLPTGPMGKPVAGEAEFVIEFKNEFYESGDKIDGTWKREVRKIWSTEEDPLTIRKRRDFRVAPIEHGSLEEVFARAGVVI